MATTTVDQAVQSMEVQREEQIAASCEIVFETILEQLGPLSDMPDGTPFPMVLEAWPGGRWFRDLGNNSGHLWGHVQVIKPPKLLEVCGPLFMSYAAISHLQYRLVPEGAGTRLHFVHRAIGMIEPAHREGVALGWAHGLQHIRTKSENKSRRA